MKEILIDDFSYEELINSDFLSKFFDNNFLELKLLFKADFKNSKKIRDMLIYILDYFKTPWIWKNRFVIIIDELVNNSVEHWSLVWDINAVDFLIKKDAEENLKICIEVKDSGRKHNITAEDMYKLQEEKSNINFLKHTSIRWRWLFLIIKNLVDEIYFEDRQKWWITVWVKKQIKLKD